MEPAAVAVAMVVLAAGFDSVTVKPSVALRVELPATLTVMVWLVWPAAKLTVPDGSTPPAKAPAGAGLLPDPLTAQWALVAMLVLPARLTVKVNGVVVPVAPSASVAFAAAIASVALPVPTV